MRDRHRSREACLKSLGKSGFYVSPQQMLYRQHWENDDFSVSEESVSQNSLS